MLTKRNLESAILCLARDINDLNQKDDEQTTKRFILYERYQKQYEIRYGKRYTQLNQLNEGGK